MDKEKKFIYCDESGDISFAESSASKYFCICSLTIPFSKKNTLGNIITTSNKRLYKMGWPKDFEIKASTLYSLNHKKNVPEQLRKEINGKQYIKDLLSKISQIISPRIDYIAINKHKILSQQLRDAAYGIAYNYFSGTILIPLITEVKNCSLVMDRRNKELHGQKRFDGYLQTKILEKNHQEQINASVEISHQESDKSKGLQAVDYFSWSVYRKISFKDSSYFSLFENCIHKDLEWYV